MSSLRLQILGPLRVWRDGVELDPGPRQQAYLLALLVARAGRPVSAGELIDLIWDADAPATAVNVVHKYIGALRRVFEPTLPPREVGSYLHRHGNGYQFVGSPGMIDVIMFREHVEAARSHLTRGDSETALDHYAEALTLWHGPAGHGLTHGSAAIPVFAALDSEFFDACAAVADLAVSSGQPERALPHLRLAASMAPLHEAVQASLVTTLAAAGQQAEALSVFRVVRARLAENLGIEPGHALQAAHHRVLNQALPPTARQAVAEPASGTLPGDRVGLIGRVEELALLRQAVEAALSGGNGLVIVEGEPGVGKTRLLEEASAEADRHGVHVVWGHCLDGNGTPAMWPWIQVINAVLGRLPTAARQEWLDGELRRLVDPGDHGSAAPALPDNGTQFRLFERVVAVIGQTSARRPVLLVVDDLQWADTASLHLFGHLAARLPGGTVVIGALRDRAPAPGTELSRALAAASRVPGHRRIRLGPLSDHEVAELVRRETGGDPSPGAARTIRARTAGNPFLVRELSRTLHDGGVLIEDAVRTGVPPTVHDIVRDRMTGLDHDSRDLLQLAAFIGREVDLGLLARASGFDVAACLDRLEPLDALGLLGPVQGDPFSFRFTHDLVRESVAETTPPPRATRLHLNIANALDHIGSDDESVIERLAHHLWAAGPLADPARTALALMRAGRRAAMKSAFEAARPRLRSAVQVARTAGLAELELSALSLLTTVVRRRAGYGAGPTVELLRRAEYLACDLGRPAAAADFSFSRMVGAAHQIEADRGGLARRLFDQGMASADPVVRVYGLEAWGLYQWDQGNIGEAYRCLSGDNRTLLDDVVAQHEDSPLRGDLLGLWPLWQAVMTALHGDLDTARALLDTAATSAGDNPYATSICAHYVAMIASMAGDAVLGLRAVEQWTAANPEHYFVQADYLRLSWCWARALTGDDPVGAVAEAEEVLAATLVEPPRWGLPFHCGLIAEMALAAGMLDEAADALDRADHYLDTHGQRFAESLLLLLRARLRHARGEPTTAVRAAAERARALSVEREAHLFAHRAEEFLTELAGS